MQRQTQLGVGSPSELGEAGEERNMKVQTPGARKAGRFWSEKKMIGLSFRSEYGLKGAFLF